MPKYKMILEIKDSGIFTEEFECHEKNENVPYEVSQKMLDEHIIMRIEQVD